MHWAHGIEDTNTLDVDEYYYLFSSPTVRTQYHKRGSVRGHLRGYSRGYPREDLRGHLKECHKEDSVTLKTIISTNINKLSTECDPPFLTITNNL